MAFLCIDSCIFSQYGPFSQALLKFFLLLCCCCFVYEATELNFHSLRDAEKEGAFHCEVQANAESPLFVQFWFMLY